jgi:hypothetical protein
MIDKNIYIAEELPITDYLMTFRDDLIKDFLAYHTDFDQETMSKVIDVRPGGRNHDHLKTSKSAWRSQPLLYRYTPDGITLERYKEFDNNFPTAVKIIEEFNSNLGIVLYSILEPNSSILRHTGIENRTGEYLRIHLPLIVPPGDIFLEVNGEEITWDKPFGFNNQKVHSAHNHTPHRRLVFLIDIKRSFLGLPPGKPWRPKDEFLAKPFVRKPKEIPPNPVN